MSWVQITLAILVVVVAAALIIWREKARATGVEFSTFLRDVVEEVKKITWPGKDELRRATLVILAFVLVVAVVIGTMDVVLQFLLVRLPGRLG